MASPPGNIELKNTIAIAKRDVLSDLRATPWLWVLFACWTVFIPVGLAILVLDYILHASTYFQTSYGDGICYPDGKFSLGNTQKYTPWEVSSFFQITMSYGSLTFTQAKVIDVIWNAMVGRLGQAAVGISLWKAIATYIQSSLDKQPVTFGTYFTLFMADQPSFRSAFRLVKDSSRQPVVQSKRATIYLSLSIAYVLSFSVLVSSMTGYTLTTGAFVDDGDGSLLSIHKFYPVAYVVHDGSRVNLTDDFLVTYEAYNASRRFIIENIPNHIDLPCLGRPDTKPAFGGSDLPDTQDCTFSLLISNYVGEYGFLGLNQTETQWMNQTIPAPALNISSFYIPYASGFFSGFYGGLWIDPRTGQTPYNESSNVRFTVYGTDPPTLYSIQDIQASGSCQALDGAYSYRWGFSFLQLFIFLILTGIWSIGTYMTWLKGHLSLRNRKDGEVPSKYRATLQLATQINADLAALTVDDPDTLTNRKLDLLIDKTLHGGRF